MAKPRQNRMTPQAVANMVIPKINLEIYFDSGDSYPLAFAARLAMRPIKVLSPVNSTIPLPDPSLHSVEKKAIFFVSSGFSLSVHSTVLLSS